MYVVVINCFCFMDLLLLILLNKYFNINNSFKLLLNFYRMSWVFWIVYYFYLICKFIVVYMCIQRIKGKREMWEKFDILQIFNVLNKS